MKLNYFSILVILLISIILISGCTQQNKQTPSSEHKSQILKGVSLSPKSFGSEDFLDFLKKSMETGDIVSWAGDWNELSDTQNGAPTIVASLASTYNYIPLIEAQFFTQASGKLIRPFDNTTKQIYKNSAVAFADRYKPKYLAFGIEVNTLYEKSPADFDMFVQFFSEVYDAVKIKSPNTKVFTIFQLEKMKGLGGGLFGGINDPTKSQWQMLDRFPDSDIIAFTTYPGLIYKDPVEMPEDYYTEIKLHTTKPIAFTEIGWHSNVNPVGWESSEEEQLKFIEKFFYIIQNINSDFIIWSFMYDPNTMEPFESMGLINKNGTKKLGWNRWVMQN